MSERNKCIQAIIISITQQGENNKSVCILSPDIGLFYAILYGGSKSRLRSLIQPFNIGKLWIYTDETKKSIKITDFEVSDYHLNIHTNLYKIWSVNLACEILLKTHCAGDENRSFYLLKAFIKGIDSSEENEAKLGTIRFLWRYTAMLGVQPEILKCSYCKCRTLSKEVHYMPFSSSVVCSDCIKEIPLTPDKNMSFKLSKNAIIYLASINELSPGKVRALKIDSESVNELKQFTFYIIEQAIGSKLKTIETGMGIL